MSRPPTQRLLTLAVLAATACGLSSGEADPAESSTSTSVSSTTTDPTAGPSSTDPSSPSTTVNPSGSTSSADATGSTTAASGSDETGFPMPVPDCDPPSWYPETSGTVVAIPALAGAATLNEVVPQPTPFNRPVRMHIRAWNGGVLLHLDGSPYLATHGGGHQGYAGNEINVFGPLCGSEDADSPSWSVLWGPTPENEINEGAPWNFDGTPNISHTRDTMAVLGQSFFRFWQGGPYPGVNGSRDTMRFDLGALSWDAEDVHPDVPDPNSGGIRGTVVADPEREVFWVVHDGNSRLMSYDPATLEFTTYESSYNTAIELTAGIDPGRDQLLVWDGRNGDYNLLFDLSDPDADPIVDGFSGSFPPYKSGIEFDPDRDRYVSLGNGESLNLVHELDPETLIWTERSFEGAMPTHDDTNGHFGRFRYVPTLKGYVFVGSSSGPVYFCRS